jgi:pyrimidine operon attenuation protein/uracil phosphoribosyltransferase
MKSKTKRARVRAAVDAMPTHGRFRSRDLKEWMDNKWKDSTLRPDAIGNVLRAFPDVKVEGNGWFSKKVGL